VGRVPNEPDKVLKKIVAGGGGTSFAGTDHEQNNLKVRKKKGVGPWPSSQ